MVKDGQKIPKEVLHRVKEAAKYPINLEACPELSPEEFAFMRAGKKRQTVSIRLAPECIEGYRKRLHQHNGGCFNLCRYPP
jgi:hypothetical protein